MRCSAWGKRGFGLGWGGVLHLFVGDVAEGDLEVVDEILGVLNTAGEADQVIENASLDALLEGDGSVGHDGGVVSKGLDSTEGFGEGKDVQVLHELTGLADASLEPEGDNTSTAGHLTLGELVLGVRGQAGVRDLLDARVALKELSDGQSVLAMTLHAYVQGLGSTDGQERVEGRGDGSDRILQETKLTQKLGITTNSDTHNDVTVTVEVLSNRVHDEIRAELQGKLAVGGHEGVVDDDQKLVLVSDGSELLDIYNLQQRVGRSLNPEHLGVGLNRGLQERIVGQIKEGERDAVSRGHLGEVAVGSSIQVVHGNDVVSRAEDGSNGRSGRRTAGKSNSPLTLLQSGNIVLKRQTGRVSSSGILISLYTEQTSRSARYCPEQVHSSKGQKC